MRHTRLGVCHEFQRRNACEIRRLATGVFHIMHRNGHIFILLLYIFVSCSHTRSKFHQMCHTFFHICICSSKNVVWILWPIFRFYSCHTLKHYWVQSALFLTTSTRSIDPFSHIHEEHKSFIQNINHQWEKGRWNIWFKIVCLNLLLCISINENASE